MNIISGSTYYSFAESVAKKLKIRVTDSLVTRYPDSETSFEINESVREKHIFIIQSKSNCINDDIMELLIICHTCKLVSSHKITVVLTYFPYARQNKKQKSRSPITSKLFANLLQVSGVDSVITMDLHSPQIQGFFNIPVDNITAESLIIKYIKESIPNWEKSVIVSPDAGGTKRVTSLATKMGLNFAIIHKHKNKSNKQIESMVLVGDIKKRVVIIVDDLADTCRTVVSAAQKLEESNALKVYAIVIHGVLSEQSFDLINNSCLQRFVVTNTVPQHLNKERCNKLVVIDVSNVFANAINRIFNGQSISDLSLNVPNS
ncbi:ribose-phosphate pyrophosphokinase 2-like [Oppia nitens]|uniref:ribose-phosphate pyrophosphokinase 2-like n=1 Tax=Oppia nitens TaxID=1686743 RepID=UPI0023DA2EC6|nr:ribose-phosphate pyrophosphokinase 2-like [Oppia nitens]